jgi:Lrp/AsnC family leucine-responsive transcriptional regulator
LTEQSVFGAEIMQAEIDRIDQRLLALLQNEGRISNTELAERLSLSASACLRRTQRLEQTGVISSYRALLSADALGLPLQAMVRVQLVRHDRPAIEAFASLVGDWPEVIECWSLTGDMDYLLHIRVADLAHFNRLLMDQLLARAEVRDVNSSFVLATVKANAGLPLDSPHLKMRI